MTPNQLEQLLYEGEGTTLDFKRDQYPFAKASDDEKSELLKDILGFANCWRRTVAFILIGVEEVQGGRAVVHGISNHLPDHSLQQFINNLTNRPLQFVYEACEFDGKQVGVICIELQRRPVYLKQDYGKLKKGEVYVRRGSSTDPTKPAVPDEIADMGTSLGVETREASLLVEFASTDREQSLGEQIELSAEYCEMPSSDQIPKLREPDTDFIHVPGGRIRSVATHVDRHNPHYYRQLARYAFTCRLVRTIRLMIANSGDAPAKDVRLEITVSNGSGFGFVDRSDIPNAPMKRELFLKPVAMNWLRGQSNESGSVHIEKSDYETKVEVDCGNLQPGRKVWTDALNIVVMNSGVVQITGSMFAANLPKPQSFTLSIKAEITRTEMTVAELVALGDG